MFSSFKPSTEGSALSRLFRRRSSEKLGKPKENGSSSSVKTPSSTAHSSEGSVPNNSSQSSPNNSQPRNNLKRDSRATIPTKSRQKPYQPKTMEGKAEEKAAAGSIAKAPSQGIVAEGKIKQPIKNNAIKHNAVQSLNDEQLKEALSKVEMEEKALNGGQRPEQWSPLRDQLVFENLFRTTVQKAPSPPVQREHSCASTVDNLIARHAAGKPLSKNEHEEVVSELQRSEKALNNGEAPEKWSQLRDQHVFASIFLTTGPKAASSPVRPEHPYASSTQNSASKKHQPAAYGDDPSSASNSAQHSSNRDTHYNSETSPSSNNVAPPRPPEVLLDKRSNKPTGSSKSAGNPYSDITQLKQPQSSQSGSNYSLQPQLDTQFKRFKERISADRLLETRSYEALDNSHQAPPTTYQAYKQKSYQANNPALYGNDKLSSQSPLKPSSGTPDSDMPNFGNEPPIRPQDEWKIRSEVNSSKLPAERQASVTPCSAADQQRWDELSDKKVFGTLNEEEQNELNKLEGRMS